ncbi:hypothetical protein [Rheinheimera sp.]|uniref:hypothetical protein n=1 Tax=Rheinheimera sp. TaxID=1869214 RepID=UPI004047B2DD
MELKTIKISVLVQVPANATDEQVSDFVDAKFGECTGSCTQLTPDNPCLSEYEIEQADWSLAS